MDDPSRGHTTGLPYGRVTNASRFAMLHPIALHEIDRLQRDFAVTRVVPYENDQDLDRFARVPLARPTVALIPHDDACAPLVVAFSSFPGLLVRAGWYYQQSFPSCGCDACDETAEGEADRFQRLVHAVTTGRFRENLERSGDGAAALVWELESAGQRSREQLFLTSAQASDLKRRSISQWKAWIPRRIDT